MELNPASLRALRVSYGWSLTKFALACQTTPSHLSNVESGRRHASPALIRRFATVLTVPLAAIVTDFRAAEVA